MHALEVLRFFKLAWEIFQNDYNYMTRFLMGESARKTFKFDKIDIYPLDFANECKK